MVLYLLNDKYKLLHETSGISAFLSPGSFKQNPVNYRKVLQNVIFSMCLRKKEPKMTMTFIVFSFKIIEKTRMMKVHQLFFGYQNLGGPQ